MLTRVALLYQSIYIDVEHFRCSKPGGCISAKKISCFTTGRKQVFTEQYKYSMRDKTG
jgi:hypothetical protein